MLSVSFPPHKFAVFHVMTNWKSFDAPLKCIIFKQSFVKISQLNGSGFSMGDNIQTKYRQYTDTQTAPRKSNIFLFKTKSGINSDFNLPITELT
jgi:hypothetical protein